MLRGAIVGFGNVALHGHLPGWRRRDDVEIVAVTDARPERRDVARAELPGARWYDSPEALFDEARIDFVDICTPPSSHPPLIRVALERGTHVLCEKPLVSSAIDLAAAAELALAHGRVVHTVNNWHHAPMVQATTELIAAGGVGRVTRLAWRTLRTRPAGTADERAANWRLDPDVAGGGVLTDHGWHVFYVLSRWAGARASAVRARLETRRHACAVEDTATVEIVFPGATAEVFLTWAADARQNAAEVTGTEGTIALDNDRIVLRRANGETREWRHSPPLSDGSQHPEWFGAVVTEFMSEIAAARPTRANFSEAASCVAIETAARESSRRRGALLAVAPPPPYAEAPI